MTKRKPQNEYWLAQGPRGEDLGDEVDVIMFGVDPRVIKLDDVLVL